jgi:hypothetical protein
MTVQSCVNVCVFVGKKRLRSKPMLYLFVDRDNKSWTNFSQTQAKFSNLEVAVCMPLSIPIWRSLKMKTLSKLLLGSLLLDITLSL